jgi:uncharacterized membrane protein (UPF0136 family)
LIDPNSTPQNRIRSLIFLVICGLSVIVATGIGIDDNLPGILLAYLAATAFVLTFVHPWKTSRQFRRLLYTSILGFVVFVLLHNAFEAIASNMNSSDLVQALLNGAGAVFFILSTLVCPAGLLVGIIGIAVTTIKNRNQPTSGSTKAA